MFSPKKILLILTSFISIADASLIHWKIFIGLDLDDLIWLIKVILEELARLFWLAVYQIISQILEAFPFLDIETLNHVFNFSLLLLAIYLLIRSYYWYIRSRKK